jgi:D-lactate dehydrogenase
VLRNETAVDAVELFDRASLRECEADEQMTTLVPDIKGADNMAAALLIECRGQDEGALQARIAEVRRPAGAAAGAAASSCCCRRRAAGLAAPGAWVPAAPAASGAGIQPGAPRRPRPRPRAQVHRALRRSGLPFGAKAAEPKALEDYPFHHDAKSSKTFWDVRKGLIPIVGAAREVRRRARVLRAG